MSQLNHSLPPSGGVSLHTNCVIVIVAQRVRRSISKHTRDEFHGKKDLRFKPRIGNLAEKSATTAKNKLLANAKMNRISR